MRSLALQGGPFTPDDAAEFRALPFAMEAGEAGGKMVVVHR
jgi:predicted HD phosphohydrolase